MQVYAGVVGSIVSSVGAGLCHMCPCFRWYLRPVSGVVCWIWLLVAPVLVFSLVFAPHNGCDLLGLFVGVRGVADALPLVSVNASRASLRGNDNMKGHDL